MHSKRIEAARGALGDSERTIERLNELSGNYGQEVRDEYIAQAQVFATQAQALATIALAEAQNTANMVAMLEHLRKFERQDLLDAIGAELGAEITERRR